MYALTYALALVATLEGCKGFVLPVPTLQNGLRQWNLAKISPSHSPVTATVSTMAGLLHMSTTPESEVEGEIVEEPAAEETAVEEPIPEVVAPAVKTVAGPAMQSPAEAAAQEAERRKNMDPDDPRTAWAKKSMKKGIVLQGVVLAFVAFLSTKPTEVSNLSICAPFAKGGCVDFVTWLQIVFGGAPVPPM